MTRNCTVLEVKYPEEKLPGLPEREKTQLEAWPSVGSQPAHSDPRKQS